MIIYDGRYSWDGKKDNFDDPVSWWPGSYDLKVVNLQKGLGNVILLKPYLCLFSNTGKGFSISTRPVNFARRVCREFGLSMEQVLWVEMLPGGKKEMEVVSFSRKCSLGETSFYTVSRRSPMEGEMKIISEVGSMYFS